MNIDTQDLSSYIPGYDDYVDDTKPVYSTKEYYDMKELLESEIEDKEEEIERQKEVINGMIDNEEKYCLEINKLKSIIKEVYEYLDKKKDVPEWWDTDFMICMDILKGGTGDLRDILGVDKK